MTHFPAKTEIAAFVLVDTGHVISFGGKTDEFRRENGLQLFIPQGYNF